jgi:hypothetical protein
VPTFSSGQPAVRTAGYGEVAFCEVVQALAEKRAEAAASPGRRARSPDSGPPSRSGCPRPRPSSTGELATATAAQSCLCTAPRSWAARSTSTPRCWWPTGWRSSWHPTRPPEPKGGTPPRPAGRVGRSPARPLLVVAPRARPAQHDDPARAVVGVVRDGHEDPVAMRGCRDRMRPLRASDRDEERLLRARHGGPAWPTPARQTSTVRSRPDIRVPRCLRSSGWDMTHRQVSPMPPAPTVRSGERQRWTASSQSFEPSIWGRPAM